MKRMKMTVMALAVLVMMMAAGAQAAISPPAVIDLTTQGTWVGVYGTQGYILGSFDGVTGNYGTDRKSLPSYISSFANTFGGDWTWVAGSADVRAMQDPNNTSIRNAGCWYIAGTATFTLTPNQTRTFRLGLYFLDWDQTTRGFTMTVTGAGLTGTETVSPGYNGGKWYVYPVSVTNGTPIVISITWTGGGGNATVSAITFDPPPAQTPLINNGVAQNVLAYSADIVGTLMSTGSAAATTYLYWATNDCTTNATAWINGGGVTNLGSYAQGTIFTNSLSGLTAGTTYYFNHMASNSYGTVWASTNGSPTFRTQVAADFSSWQKNLPITFAGYTPPGSAAPLVNFPALVVLSTNINGFSYSDFLSPTNRDLRFTAADGATELNYEIDTWNTNGSSYVWVQVPFLNGTNTTIKAFWSKSGQSAPAYTTNGATWSEGYMGVWHASQTPSGANSILDSSTNAVNLSPQGSGSTLVSGEVGGSVSLNGSGYLSQTLSGVGLTRLMVSFWLNPTTPSPVFQWANAASSGGPYILIKNATGNTLQLYTGDGAYQPANMPLANSVWSCVTLTLNSSRLWSFYINGQLTGTYQDGGAAGNLGNQSTASGVYFGNGYQADFSGKLDEMRISAMDRSSNWVWASYMTVASNGTFAGSFNNYGSVQTVTQTKPQVSNVASSNVLNTSVGLIGATVLNCAGATVYLYSSTTDGMNNPAAWTSSGGSVINCGSSFTDGQNFTNTITGLTPNTTYYWNYCASNSAGVGWAATVGSPSFKTMGTPAVNNGIGPSGVGFGTATLNGNLTSGAQAGVRIFWGTDSNNWANTNDLGTRAEGAFSVSLTGLTATTYYYQCQATNAYGTAWSAVTNFTPFPLGAYYVTPTGSGLANGPNWANAFSNIQSALDICCSTGIIYLQSGNYPISAQLSLAGKSNVTVSGGYVGSGAPGALSGTNSTIYRSTNSVRILYVSAATNLTLQRLTLTGGSLVPPDGGAGLYVSNCTGFAALNCTISSNTVASAGNDTYIYGGGVYVNASDVTLSNCVVYGNQASSLNPGSRASCYGGGIYVNSGTCRVTCCELRGNLAACWATYGGRGGAICLNAGLLDVRNSLIAANDAAGTSYGNAYGDGVDVVNGTATLSQCTIVGNGGSGVQREAGTLTVTNSILWGNIVDATGTLTLAYCDVQSVGVGVTANNCLSTDPLFERGLYLNVGSPCVNAGGDTAVNLGMDGLTTRADGTADSGTVDLGYHFTAGNNASVADLYVATTGNDSTGTGASGTPYATITKALSLAQVGTRVHVAVGTYANTTETMPLTITKDGVQILGTNATLTQLNGGGAKLVLQILNSCGDTRVEGLTVTRGYQVVANGGGVNAVRSVFTMASCNVLSNMILTAGDYTEGYGGGLYLKGCVATITNCQVRQNVATNTANRCDSCGGGVAAFGGHCDFVDSVVAQNASYGNVGLGNDDFGGGLYLNGGVYSLRNCLVATNSSLYEGDGICVVAGSSVQLRNVTVANNGGEGLRNAGTVTATNCILWNNYGVDVTGTVALAWCDVGVKDPAATTNNFCLSADPLFVNPAALDYHEQSLGGSWHGGAWSNDAATSPCIDAGDPADTRSALEPQPNGGRINMGAYGGEAQASKTDWPRIANAGYANPQTLSCDVIGNLFSTGMPTTVYVFYGAQDMGQVQAGWGGTNQIAGYPALGLVTNTLSGLTAQTTYWFRFLASNSVSMCWAPTASNFTTLAAAQPIVDNNGGATNVAAGTTVLRGNLANGPSGVTIYWGPVDGNTNPAAWANNVILSSVGNGVFSNTISGLEYGMPYYYRCWAGNANGSSWAPATTNFLTMRPSGVFAPALTNAPATALMPTTATLNAALVCSGSVYNVLAYWNTSNGGTNAALWGTPAVVGSYSNAVSQALTCAASSLTSNTTYYFTFRATNTVEDLWSTNVLSFKTAGSPSVNNAGGATAITFTTATLNGNLANGGLSSVRIYWGTDSNNWANTADFGLSPEGAFSTNLTGLSMGTTYYYRCFASNQYGTAWAGAATNFMTTAPTVLYVTPTGAGAMNGVDWADAFGSIQPALDACSSYGTIYLQSGSYPIGAQLSLSNKTGVTILGGYTGSGTPGALGGVNSTIRGTNNVRILYVTAAPNMTLQRLTLTGGNLLLSQPDYGAGLCVSNCPGLAVSDCTIASNTISVSTYYSASCGGGLALSASDVTLSNCTLNANQALETDGHGSAAGGGIYVNSGTCRVVRCELRGNVAAGGVSSGGGGHGGAICLNAGLLDVRNALIAANDVSGTAACGDGVDVVSGTATLSLCTLVNNGGIGVQREGGALTVSNSILWGNLVDATGALTLAYCDAQSVGAGVTANNGLSADPLFERGLYLASGSPCANAGNDTAANLAMGGLTTRADGTTDAGTVDLGYHFAAGNNASVADLYVAPAPTGNDSTGTGASGSPFATITKALSLAQAGTHVHVAAGAYTNTTETMPLTIAKDGVQILGTNAALTQLSGGGSKLVLQILNSCGDTRLEGLTIANGYQAANGGGLSASLSTLTLASCNVMSNMIYAAADYWQETGAGLYLSGCMVTITNCQIRRNDATQHTGTRSESSGGGLAALGGRCDIVDSAVEQNTSAGNVGLGYLDYGGGLYLGAGIYSLRNCLVATNSSVYQGDGIYVAAGGSLQIRNVTIANNGGEGLRNAGTVTATNSIFWGNGVDVTGAVALAWCDAGVVDPTATTNGYGLSADPLFVNPAALDYHEQSMGGSWHGGAWSNDAATSPCIDAGDPADSRSALEPLPNGGRINMGAYGGEAQASRTDWPRIVNVGFANPMTYSCDVVGNLLSTGLPTTVYVFYGTQDMGQVQAGWAGTNLVAGTPGLGSITNTISGLAAQTTYWFRFLASNAVDLCWAPTASAFTTLAVTPPAADNDVGVLNVSPGTTVLRGSLTNGPATVTLYWGLGDGTTNPVAWANYATLSSVANGIFSNTVSGLEYGLLYYYRCWAGNANGSSWAPATTSFTSLRPTGAFAPGLTNAPAVAVTPSTATLSAALVCSGAVYTVQAYWNTSNGGTNAALWGTPAAVGSYSNAASQGLACAASSLASNTTYYFTFRATNVVEDLWATNVLSFKTAGGPAVNNGSGPAAVTYTTATLNGNLANGSQASVRIFWGTDPNNWANTADLGVCSEGAFSTNLTGLGMGTLYYYRCFASNQYGAVWADTATNFTTLAPPLVYVTPTGAGTMNGMDWSNAMSSIQQALNTCGSYGTIYLQSGGYPIGTPLSLSNKTSVTILGGYAGSGAPGALSGVHSTIRGTNNVRILYVAAATNLTLQRLTLTGGYLPGDYGAGLRVDNCPGLAVLDCTISNNTTTTSANDSSIYGGGIYANASDMIISNCQINANQATITGARGSSYGGGLYVNSGTCRVMRTELHGNSASCVGANGGRGGAICLNAGLLDVRDALIAGNDAAGNFGYGDGVDVVGGTATLSLCTIVGNGGSGVQREGGSLTVSNSILWANVLDATGALTLAYCDAQTVGVGVTVNNGLSTDPLFERGLYLASGSPCANAGSDTAANLGMGGLTTRADGTTDAGTVDLGYHFAAGNNASVAELYVAPSPAGNDSTGTGAAGAPFATITKALSLAQAGTHVHVAAGTYATNTAETLPLMVAKDGVQILGTNAALTQLSGSGSKLVVQILNSCGDTRLEGLTIANGFQVAPVNGSVSGGGLYAALSEITIASCTVTNNKIYASNSYGYDYGAGAYLYSCFATITNCLIKQNDATPHAIKSQGCGGGVAAMGGHCDFVDSVIAQNITASDPGNSYYDYGAGLYLGGGIYTVRNCLITTNLSQYGGDGIYVAAGSSVQLRNVTIANNGGEGLRSTGTVSVISSILWNNGTDVVADVTGAVTLAWSDAGAMGPLVTTNTGCLSTDPLFVNAAAGDYHEQSLGGSWHGGAWSADAATSPCIDAGDPADSRSALEPLPNGSRINMGAYGGEAQASKTDWPRIVNVGSANPLTYSCDTIGNLLSTGMPTTVYVFYGATDMGPVLTGWDSVRQIPGYPGLGAITNTLTGLAAQTTYWFRFLASNAVNMCWSPTASTFTTLSSTPPTADNDGGALNVAAGTSVLRGSLTNGPSPVTIYWGPSDGGTNPAAWANTATLGSVPSGVFSNTVSGLVYGMTYYYRCWAGNANGANWAASTTNFTSMRPAGSFAPALANASATVVTPANATLNGTLSCSGAVYTVQAYWSTSNGGTNAVLWGNSAAAGSCSNVLSQGVTGAASGLASNTTYYFTFRATNAADDLWATNVLSFKSVGGPAVNNGSGASAVSYTSATLNGNLVNGGQASVRIYWGTDTNNWSNSTDLGLVSEGAFSTNLTGLGFSTLYYYRCFASNQYGVAWADAVTSFTTLTPPSIYVTPTGAGAMNGSGWANAFGSVQAAVDACVNNSAIYLQSGSYPISAQVSLSNLTGVTISGGYTGSGTPGALSGVNSTVYRGTNNIRILYVAAATNITLQRLTLTGGYLPQSDNGAGIRVEKCPGFAMTDCAILSNTIYASAQYSAVYGGGLYVNASDVTLNNCSINGNQASTYYQAWYSVACGGGIYVNSGTCRVSRCELHGNSAVDVFQTGYGGRGGGICLNAGLLDVRNCLIAANDASGGYGLGDGVDVLAGTATLSLCTIVDNGGSGVQREGGNVSVSNSILWGNLVDATGTLTLAYCDVQSAAAGVTVNNGLSADPLFERGLYLASGSPCMDAGNDTAVNLAVGGLTTRADGTTDTGTVDLGYHYAAGNNTNVAELYVAPAPVGNDGTGNGSAGTPYATITKALSLAQVGTHVHVAAGTYSKTNEAMPLTIAKDGVQVLGTNAALTQLTGGGSVLVVQVLNSCGDTRLEGLTIANGQQVAAPGGSINGGGVYASLSALTMASCVVTNNKILASYNYGGDYGAGVYLYGCLALVTNCQIKLNDATPHAAAGYSFGSGGGVAALGGHCDFVGSTIAQNITAGDLPHATYDHGGGLYLGAGVYTVRNCLITTNSSQADSDGIYVAAGGNAQLRNVTIVNNLGEGLHSTGTVTVTSSILWSNGTDVVADVTGAVTVAWSDAGVISSMVTTNVGYISTDPLFVDPAAGDYHEQSQGGSWHGGLWLIDPVTSPCIDAGDPADPLGALEPQLNTRNRINMGVYGGTAQASKSQPPRGVVFIFK